MARRGGSYLVVGQYTDRGEVAVNFHTSSSTAPSSSALGGSTGAHLVAYVNLLPALTRSPWRAW